MQVFWRQGYVATGMSQLLAVAQLKPGSFYNAFDSKKALFLRCIQHYRDTVVKERVTTLLTQRQPLEAIEHFFLSAFEPVPRANLLGCLLTNTASEIGSDDAEIRQAVTGGLNRIEKGFAQRLSEARDDGVIDAGRGIDALALQLLTAFQGFNVIGKVTKSKAKMRKITQITMESLVSGAA